MVISLYVVALILLIILLVNKLGLIVFFSSKAVHTIFETPSYKYEINLIYEPESIKFQG
jgi:hypothetical protein